MVSVGVAYFLLLSSLGLVITAQAQNCSKPVGGPNMDLKDSDYAETFPDGSKVSFVCDIGYMSAGGSKIVTCSAGSWSPVLLKCERKSCGSPGELDNGQIHYIDGDVLFGDKIGFTCNTGFKLVGKRQTACGDKAEWLDRLPVCEVVQCQPPPKIGNGTFSDVKENYNYGETIRYQCDRDFTLSGSKTRSCSEDETFKPNPPTCIKVLCGPVAIQNSTWIQGSRPPYGYLASVTFKCNPGFGNEATHIVTCGLDNKWSPEHPRCEPNAEITTMRPSITTKVTTTTTTTTTHVRPPTPDSPDNGPKWWQSWWFILLAVICSGVLIACGCRYCGCLAFIKNKRGSLGGYSGNVATKDDDRGL